MKWLRIIIVVGLLFGSGVSLAWVEGIYVTQSTVQHTSKIQRLIREAKAAGIDSFVIDAAYRNSRYERNIRLVHQAGIRYVARIVVFPHGGSYAQVNNRAIWQKKLKLAQYAVSLGAKEIQLDYIRYNTKVRPSSENAHKINQIIQWFGEQLEPSGVKLQVAVFGETSFGPSLRIGQNVKLFAPNVDVLNPMVYPSHYEPHAFHGRNPYLTVHKSLMALRKQFDNSLPFELVPYIEVSNYRRAMGFTTRVNYIKEQIRAVRDSDADGWYAWSPNNQYRALFYALKSLQMP